MFPYCTPKRHKKIIRTLARNGLSRIWGACVCVFVCVCVAFVIKGIQKQPSWGVLKKDCSENIQQVYRRTPMTKCDLNTFQSHFCAKWLVQKQLPRGVRRERCSENMQQIYGKHPCRSVISTKLLWNFIEITLRHGCFPVNLLHIFRTSFLKNTPGWIFLLVLISR